MVSDEIQIQKELKTGGEKKMLESLLKYKLEVDNSDIEMNVDIFKSESRFNWLLNRLNLPRYYFLNRLEVVSYLRILVRHNTELIKTLTELLDRQKTERHQFEMELNEIAWQRKQKFGMLGWFIKNMR